MPCWMYWSRMGRKYGEPQHLDRPSGSCGRTSSSGKNSRQANHPLVVASSWYTAYSWLMIWGGHLQKWYMPYNGTLRGYHASWVDICLPGCQPTKKIIFRVNTRHNWGSIIFTGQYPNDEEPLAWLVDGGDWWYSMICDSDSDSDGDSDSNSNSKKKKNNAADNRNRITTYYNI